jgi:hypothetical protein
LSDVSLGGRRIPIQRPRLAMTPTVLKISPCSVEHVVVAADAAGTPVAFRIDIGAVEPTVE